MAIPSRQIGQSTQANLLWQISKQLERLICVAACGCGTTTTTTSSSSSSSTTTTTTGAPVTITQYEVACQEYTWPVTGLTYTDSDEITETVGNVTYILYLTILPGTSDETVTDTVTSTSPYIWFNGQEYTASGSFTISYPCNGFTYTFYLDLTIIPPTTTTTTTV